MRHEAMTPDQSSGWPESFDPDEPLAIAGDASAFDAREAKGGEMLIVEAFNQGRALSHVEAFDSLTVFNPYDANEEPQLYKAWDDGFNSNENASI
jgi:hypothetical protein